MAYSLSENKEEKLSNKNVAGSLSNVGDAVSVYVDGDMYVSDKLIAFHFINSLVSMFGIDMGGNFSSDKKDKENLTKEIKKFYVRSKKQIFKIILLAAVVCNFLVAYFVSGSFSERMFTDFAIMSIISIVFFFIFYNSFTKSKDEVKYEETLLSLGKKKVDFLKKSGVNLIEGIDVKSLEDYIFWINALLGGVREHNEKIRIEIMGNKRSLPFSEYIYGDVRGSESKIAFFNLKGVCNLLEKELKEYKALEATLKPSSITFDKVRVNLLNYLGVSVEYLKEFICLEAKGSGAYCDVYKGITQEARKMQEEEAQKNLEERKNATKNEALEEIKKQRELVLRSNERLLNLISSTEKPV